MNLVGGETKLSGPNVNLTFKQKGGKMEVEGLFYGERVRLSVDARDQGPLRQVLVRSHAQGAADIPRGRGLHEPGVAAAAAGKASIELIGKAAADVPPGPQVGLAFVAILPR